MVLDAAPPLSLDEVLAALDTGGAGR